jgi:hypothetical protein
MGRLGVGADWENGVDGVDGEKLVGMVGFKYIMCNFAGE